jgi:hypothetical protein
MKVTTLLIISFLVNIWFSFVIIRLEKFHYSTQIGVCSERVLVDGKKFIRTYDDIDMYQCLSKSEPRTSDWWNLLYGLKIL